MSSLSKKLNRQAKTLGGMNISVTVVPPLKRHGFLGGIKSLLDGMRRTWYYFSHPSTVVTRQYPENRATLKFPERYRAMLHLACDENGYHRCTACGLCQKACPNGSISIETRQGASGKKELNTYVWRLDTCMVCNACVQACPFGALRMGHEFENAVFDRRLLIFTLNRYSGPPAGVLLKEPSESLRAAMMEPCEPYSGPVPINGQALPKVEPLGVCQTATSLSAQRPTVLIAATPKGEA